MTKIKGWTKISDTLYKKNNSKITLNIRKNKVTSRWDVISNNNKTDAPSKLKARTIAILWMRLNP